MVFKKLSYSKLVLMMALSAVGLVQLEAKSTNPKADDAKAVCKKGDKNCRSDKKCKTKKDKNSSSDGKSGYGKSKKACKKGEKCDSKRGGHKAKRGKHSKSKPMAQPNNLDSTMETYGGATF